MSNICGREFRGWFKSFTKTEIILCALQTIFFIALIAFVIFLVLHMIACFTSKPKDVVPAQTESSGHSKGAENKYPQDYKTTKSISSINHLTVKKEKTTQSPGANYPLQSTGHKTKKLPLTRDNTVTCTWHPSRKTKASTRYYEITDQMTSEGHDDHKLSKPDTNRLLDHDDIYDDTYENRKDFLLALVKIRPPQDLIFGCTLTIISEHWTLTAATCIEAIEEVDSLDSFVMMQGFGDGNQSVHSVLDVMIHPLFQGVNMTYDLAALKSEDTLLSPGTTAVALATLIEYSLITIGERLAILGFGKFRGIDKEALQRHARAVWLHALPQRLCVGEQEGQGEQGWAPRHLAGGRALEAEACRAQPVCAGVLRARALPCNYCAGSPLVTRGTLLAVMSGGAACGLACEPARFASVAQQRDWLRALLRSP